ncbi:MAG: ammonia-forming cytochrome c nitrite reductase subunit c552, partial [Pseudomonadota bacterium]
GGRLQALGIAWDSRPEGEGGQRWFHLYPEEKIDHRDELHWTGIQQNWNHMCSECHSTGLRKNYDVDKDSFRTTWAEIDVGCEACHGPGSRHVAWEKQEDGRKDRADDRGLAVRLDERESVVWKIQPESGNARRSAPKSTEREIQICARCHSRRGIMSEEYVHGGHLMDTHLPALLEEDLYFPDGQIKDEVFVYGSFVQSRMYAKGVTCSDCHDPHDLSLRAPGNGVCAQCHSSARFDTPEHHHHPEESAGAQCAECHMPATTYMVVDPRHDHAIRVPRPDLSEPYAVPNACTNCHQEQSSQWAAARVKEWYGPRAKADHRLPEALQAARNNAPGSGRLLAALAADEARPPIVRGTVLAELNGRLERAALPVVEKGLRDPDPQVRLGALRALDGVPADALFGLLRPLLEDPVRMVRVEAARQLAPAAGEKLAAADLSRLEAGITEYVATQQLNADRPESHLNLGNLYARTGDTAGAEKAYRTAIRLQPRFAPAYVNLADLYRALGRDAEGVNLLRDAVNKVPEPSDLHYALGLALVRQQRLSEALEPLRLASQGRPENARYAYVYAIALDGAGDTRKALLVLQAASIRHPGDSELLYTLASFSLKIGDREAAKRHAARFEKLAPGDRRA